MNNTDFNSKKLKGRGLSSAPWINNYNKSVNKKEEQNGRSMIEMLGVLAIIGVLSVGGIAGYSKAMMKYRINKTFEQFSLISANIRAFYGSQKNFNGLKYGNIEGYDADGKKIIQKAKLVPDEMWNGNEIITGVGKELNISGSDSKYALYFSALDSTPVEACVELATNDWENDGDVIGVVIGKTGTTAQAMINTTKGCAGKEGEDYYQACRGGSVVPLPISVDKAVEHCSEYTWFGIIYSK